MTANTKIEWADHTFNPWVGCAKVSPGCDHCYAESWAKRFDVAEWGAGAPRHRTSASTWRQPLKWNAQAAASQAAFEKFASDWRLSDDELRAKGFVRPHRPRVFCASLADVFDNEVPGEWRTDLWDLILRTPHLDWLLLTKRIGNAAQMLPIAPPFPNVWLGATVVNQEEADRDIPKLLATPAAKRFLSIEPMLGPADVVQWLGPRQRPNHDGYGGDHGPGWTTDFTRIDWVIVGGESGPHARPMHPDWARSLRDQCASAGVPFFFKQWGEWVELNAGPPPHDVVDMDTETGQAMATACDGFISLPGNFVRDMDSAAADEPYRGLQRVGKKAAGRLLDGRTWDEVPG